MVRGSPGSTFPSAAPRFIETIGWPTSWAAYVDHAGALGRTGFREALNGNKENLIAGDEGHRRATDKAAGSIAAIVASTEAAKDRDRPAQPGRP